jgi:hypothetical protein
MVIDIEDEYLPLASQMTSMQSNQSSEMALAEEDLDELPAEATDRESILIPVVTPKDTPSAADKQEIDGYLHRTVFLPVTMK